MKLTEEQRSRLQSVANRFSEGEGIIVRIMAEIGDMQAGDEDYLAVCRLGDGRNEARNAAFTLNMVLNGSADIPSITTNQALDDDGSATGGRSMTPLELEAAVDAVVVPDVENRHTTEDDGAIPLESRIMNVTAAPPRKK